MRYSSFTVGLALCASIAVACQEQAATQEPPLAEVAPVEAALGGQAHDPDDSDLATIAGLRKELAEAQSQLSALQTENAELRRKVDANTGPKLGSSTPTTETPEAEPAPGSSNLQVPHEDAPRWTRAMFASAKRKFKYQTDGGEATVNITAVEWKKRRWVMNRSGYQYQYREPDKGNFYLVFDFSVSTKLHDPDLPAFHVARLANNQPTTVGYMPASIEFYKWDDYGSFLGNYADYGNDFSKSESVRFTGAVELTPQQLSEPLFLVATKQGCAEREEDRFGNPPVKYNVLGCNFGLRQTNSPSAFWSEYQLVAVHNAAKLPK